MQTAHPLFKFNARLFLLMALVAGLALITAGRSAAATLPDGFSESLVVDGLSNATAMAFAPDGRLFVLQQGGAVRVIKNGVLLDDPFLTLATELNGERGLLGIAFDPDFATNHFLYLYYTTPGSSNKHNRVSRFTANGDVVLAGSRQDILDLDALSAARNHNGGAMNFGLDGKLYIATGDNANSANSQTLGSRLGKLLRLNKDGSIPTDNPFYDDATGANRAIWVMGLRNPFTFAIQPGTGKLYINDVGQQTWEEINEGSAGANYGWPTCEGLCGNPNFVNPIHTYSHDDGCAITGGAFYNPPANQYPAEYTGAYFFSDYCGGWIHVFDPSDQSVSGFAAGIDQPVDLDVGPDGALYYLARGSDAIYKIEFGGEHPPVITQQPDDQTAGEGQSATFRVNVSGSAPIEYQWQRDDADIPGADGPSYTLTATADDDGARFRVLVSNDFGDDTSDEATLTVVENRPPVPVITKPMPGALYSGGNKIKYAGTATDPEDGTLPASAFTWSVEFHHDAHTHPFMPEKSGKRSGTFTIPRTGETSANVWYRIHLTVRDSAGVEASTFFDLRPRTVTLTLATVPPGLEVTLNGQPQTAPYTFESVVGIKHAIGATSPQTMGGDSYRFRKWSDGKARTHPITAPSGDRTYTATFMAQ